VIHVPTAPESTPADMAAFEDVCRRLQGFDADLSIEGVDAFLGAVAAGPRALPVDEWLPALAEGDTFERVFADPEDHARAVAALSARLAVLRAQLDPEALMDDPDVLRLSPWIAEWTDEDRESVRVAEKLTEAQVAELQTGTWWAQSFLMAVQRLPQLWTLPQGDGAEAFHDALDVLVLVASPPDSDMAREIGARFYPDGLPGRDALVDAMVIAVQDLRMLWVDHAPRPEQRRVQATPGRNDPCPCGSGRKYKRCHGA
jgi:uncharacterized protein